MKINSTLTPCFLKSPFSSAPQMLPEVALMELKPTRIRSCAAPNRTPARAPTIIATQRMKIERTTNLQRKESFCSSYLLEREVGRQAHGVKKTKRGNDTYFQILSRKPDCLS